MAVTSVLRSRFAALAAVFILSACGGGGSGGEGDQTSAPPITTTPPTTVVPDPASPVTVPPAPVPPVQVTPDQLMTQKMASVPTEVTPVLRTAVWSGRSMAATSASVITSQFVTFEVGATGKVSALPAAAVTSAATEWFMNWTERAFPQFFPNGPQNTIDKGTFVFRYYPAGNSFLGVANDGRVYVFFPDLNPEIIYVGLMSEIPCQVDKNMCPPLVKSVSPADGAVNVPSNGTVVTVVVDQQLSNCPVVTVGTFGSVSGTFSCVGNVVTITPDATGLPAGLVTATLSGLTNSAGILMKPHTWSFTVVKEVVVPMVRVVTANGLGDSIGDAGASIVDPANRAIKQVVLDTEPGGCILPTVVDTDNQKGVAYVGAGACNVLHRVDVKTGTALPSFYIESKYVGTGIHGVAHSTKTGVVCIATSLWGRQAEVSFLRNRFICFDPTTGNKVFNSADDFLGDSTMMVTKVVYSAAHGKYYVLMAKESALIVESYSPGEYRDGYESGTAGMVVEIDALTYAKGRTWNVGSMPMDAKPLGNILYVLITGDKSLSKIDLSANATSVVTVSWATIFTGVSYPTNIEIDLEKDVYYVSDWWNSVRVMSLTTDPVKKTVADQQVSSIVLSGTPRGMGIAAGSLWVTTLWLGGKVSEVDRTTRTVKNVVNGVGDAPWDISIYDNTKP